MMLSGEREEKRGNDIFKYQVPSDKIRINDEPYEVFHTVWNKDDAQLFKLVYNQLAKKYLGVTFPIIYRRYVQNGVFYDIYKHRWCVKKDGKLLEVGYDWHVPTDGSWQKFMKAVNEKLGQVYCID